MHRAMTGSPTLTTRLQDAIAAAAGADGRAVAAVSFSIDFGAQGPGAAAISARIDRATKSLVFASGEARLPDGRTAATASGVYRVAAS